MSEHKLNNAAEISLCVTTKAMARTATSIIKGITELNKTAKKPVR